MHYYKFNLKDWAQATSHLSVIEEGVYRRMLDHYYETETPIPVETRSVMRRLRLADYPDTFQLILDEFFILESDGYHHKRCDQEIEKYHSKADANRLNGKLGGRPLKSEDNPDGFQDYPNDNLNHQPLTTNHQPIDTNVPSERDAVPILEVVKLFNKTFETLPEVKIISDKRRAVVRKRWQENKNLQTLDQWEKFFNWIKQSDFLMGRTPTPWNGFCFDWMLKLENFTKIIEGNYHRGEQ